MKYFHLLVIPLALISSTASATPPPNAELKEIVTADQADRQPGPNGINWLVVGPRDKVRQQQILTLLREGNIRTSGDFNDAALVFQHGETVDDIRLAHALATVAWQADPQNKRARWLAAASWDRLLMRLKRPQWYGTQYTKSEKTGKWELYEMDENVVTDTERASMSVPTLAEARMRAEQFNR